MFLKANDNTAIIWKDLKISYRDLLRHINYYASVFNPQTTNKVAIFSENRPEWVYSFYASWKNDSIVVPVDFMAPASDLAYILNDCRPEVIFCSRENQTVFEEAKPLLEYEPEVHIFEDQNYEITQYEPKLISEKNVQETAVIIYTSGTTGSPKGVMLAYDSLLSNVEAVIENIPIYQENRNVMVLLPLHHIFPLLGSMITPLSVNATTAFAASMTSEDIIGTLQNNSIAIVIGVPRLYAAIRKGIMDKINAGVVTRILFKLAEKINSRGFSKKLFGKVHEKFGGNVQYLVCGGAKLDEDMARDYKTLGFEMLEGFGMTEAAPMITFTRPGHWKIGSAGQSMPDLDVEIRDGEIVARGRNIMQGYYNKPRETAEVLKDGWLHTGDIGHFDKEGFLHITGRRKELIVLSNGKNINPEEIENKIAGMSPLIAEVGVFMKDDALQVGIFPDFRRIKEEGIVDIDEYFRWEVIDKYNRQTAPYKKIGKIILLKEELPKTRLGKIQRFKLVDLSAGLSKKKKKATAEPDSEEYQVIKEFLVDQTRRDIFPDDHLEIDLGLDSLDKVSFVTFLESSFGVKIDEDVLVNYPTIEKLAVYMKDNKKKISVEKIKWSEIFREKVDLKLPKTWFTTNLFKNISRIIFKFYFRFKGEGMEKIPFGPVILAPNHQSFFDGLFVSALLKNRTMKNTYFYAKEKHVHNPFIKAFANRNNIIIMDINKDLKESLQKLAEVLKKGKNIMIFPEGTRSRTGKLGNFKKAFAILSKELNVPIVPVSIKGAFEALPRGSVFPRPWKKINIKFHNPVFPKGFSYEELINNVSRELASELT